MHWLTIHPKAGPTWSCWGRLRLACEEDVNSPPCLGFVRFVWNHVRPLCHDSDGIVDKLMRELKICWTPLHQNLTNTAVNHHLLSVNRNEFWLNSNPINP